MYTKLLIYTEWSKGKDTTSGGNSGAKNKKRKSYKHRLGNTGIVSKVCFPVLGKVKIVSRFKIKLLLRNIYLLFGIISSLVSIHAVAWKQVFYSFFEAMCAQFLESGASHLFHFHIHLGMLSSEVFFKMKEQMGITQSLMSGYGGWLKISCQNKSKNSVWLVRMRMRIVVEQNFVAQETISALMLLEFF